MGYGWTRSAILKVKNNWQFKKWRQFFFLGKVFFFLTFFPINLIFFSFSFFAPKRKWMAGNMRGHRHLPFIQSTCIMSSSQRYWNRVSISLSFWGLSVLFFEKFPLSIGNGVYSVYARIIAFHCSGRQCWATLEKFAVSDLTTCFHTQYNNTSRIELLLTSSFKLRCPRWTPIKQYLGVSFPEPHFSNLWWETWIEAGFKLTSSSIIYIRIFIFSYSQCFELRPRANKWTRVINSIPRL